MSAAHHAPNPVGLIENYEAYSSEDSSRIWLYCVNGEWLMDLNSLRMDCKYRFGDQHWKRNRAGGIIALIHSASFCVASYFNSVSDFQYRHRSWRLPRYSQKRRNISNVTKSCWNPRWWPGRHNYSLHAFPESDNIDDSKLHWAVPRTTLIRWRFRFYRHWSKWSTVHLNWIRSDIFVENRVFLTIIAFG